MTSVRQWLDCLGLGQYADAFEENAVDWDLLATLSGDELKELGVGPLGHRKRILDAATKLDAPPALPQPSAAPSTGAERRQLTVMFCDLVGSTALSARMDPEEFREVLADYQSAARNAVEHYDGYIARYMGDGLLVYFGYPQAHEDDPERAVRAGLEIVERVSALKFPDSIELQVRIGIATGLVVAGDIVGEGASEERAVLGDTPNLAARLQDIAEPNAVVLSESTRRLVEGRFVFEVLVRLVLKGISGMVPAYRALSVRTGSSRFETAHSGDLTRLMGRGGELSLLMQYWERAREGEGQVVLLEGEAGMGKSRLIEAVRETIGVEASTVQRYQCSPYYTATAFHPVVDLLERTAGFALGDDSDTKLDKLETSMETLAQRNELTVALMARLLSLPTERYAPLNMTPQRQRAEQIVMLVRQLEDYCALGAMLMLVEDVHWSDPSTVELLDTMIDRIQGLPILALISYRPEFRPPWTVYGHVTSHSINRLGRKDVKGIVENIAEGRLLQQHVLEEIITKTDGVPLFAEELTKAVLETQSLSAAGQTNAMDAPVSIPSTLRDALLSRLDRLGAAKEVAQMGACIGRVFSHELVAAISSLQTSVLDDALSELVTRGLVFRQGESTEATYTFKHGLVQGVAYSSLLRSKRQQLHAQIVEILKVRSETSANVEPELLAQHCERAGMSEEAIHYFRLAGEDSNERSAYQEALQFFERGIELAQSQAPSDALQRELLRMRLAMRAGLGAFGRYEDLLDVLREAEPLAESLNDGETAAAISIHKSHVLYQLGHVDEGVQEGKRAVALATRAGQRRLVIGANAYLGMAYFFRGDLHQAIETTLPDVGELRGRYRHALFETTATSSVNWLGNLAGMHAMTGQFDAAIEYAEEACAIGEETQKPFDKAMARLWFGYVLGAAGRPDDAIEQLEPALELATSHQLAFQLPWIGAQLGFAYTLGGDPERGCELLFHARQSANTLGLSIQRIWSSLYLSYAECDAGRVDSARDHAREALNEARACRMQLSESQALRCLARALAEGENHDSEEPQNLWRQSIEIATRCGATPSVAQAQLELGVHLAKTEKEGEAHDLVNAAHEAFRRMGMPHWAKRAEQAASARTSRG